MRVAKLAEEMRDLWYSHDAVSSLVDFYGFKDKGSKAPDELIQTIREEIGPCDDRFVVPYVQRHEFEGLLFSKVEAFGQVLADAPVSDLDSIRSDFETPEHINDDRNTAPSKRIKRLIPGIEKPCTGLISRTRSGSM